MTSGNYTKRDAKRFMRKKLTAENLVDNGTTAQVFAQELLKIGRFAKTQVENGIFIRTHVEHLNCLFMDKTN